MFVEFFLLSFHSKKQKLAVLSRKIFLNTQIEQRHLSENFSSETPPIPFHAKEPLAFPLFLLFNVLIDG